MEIDLLSDIFGVRRLDANDIDIIYDLCRSNRIFYQYHPPFVTAESIEDDMRALPSGKDYKDKYYIGFFENKALVAVMDLILDYPERNIAFIGFFMMDMKYQNKGLGSKIVTECFEYLRSLGFNKIRLGVDKGSPQSNAFWKKNGFIIIGEGEFTVMELDL